MKTMRELKKSSVLAYEMLKLLSDGNESSTVSSIASFTFSFYYFFFFFQILYFEETLLN